MPDILNRLAALHDTAPTPDVEGGVVTADLRRGRTALISRRRRRTAMAGTATAGVVAIGALSYAAATDGTSRHARAEPSHTAVTTPPSQPTRVSTTPRSTTAPPTLELAAYHGRQLPGYTVKRIPKGYVLQGISGSVLDIAQKNDHTALNDFVGKIVVTVDDHPGSSSGVPVSVNGHPGHVSDQDGVQILTYDDGNSHHVDVQAWSNVHITRAQLVRFAEGVTVLPGVQVSHG